MPDIAGMTLHRARLTAAAGLLVTLSVAFVPAAHGAPAAPPAPRPSQAAPAVRAVPEHHIQARALDYRAAWDEKTDTYDKSYVYPTRGWPLSLSACRSIVDPNHVATGLNRVVKVWGWTLTPLDGQGAGVVTAASAGGLGCRTSVTLPALGRWSLSLTVLGADGMTTDTRTVTVNFRDLLVVAFGDSFVSGEGNEDPLSIPPGEQDGGVKLPKGFEFDNWTDSQCHRSGYAWPSKVAQALQSSSTTVTFLNFACSGADIANLTRADYEGGKPARHLLEPQVLAARRVIGDPRRATTRRVDVLLTTAGVNDMGFSGILNDCFFPHIFTCKRSLKTPLSQLEGKFDSIEVAASANLRVGHAFLAEYPNRVFTNAQNRHQACFGFMTAGEASWMSEQGDLMNRKLRSASRRDGWTAVPTVQRFAHRGYCATIAQKTQFRTITRSILQQHDVDGSAHPNHRGHNAVADVVKAAVRNNRVAPPPLVQLNVQVLSVRVTGVRKHWDHKVKVAVDWWRNGCGHETETISDVQSGVTVDTSVNPCFTWVVRTEGNALFIHAETSFHDDVQPTGRSRTRAIRPGTYVTNLRPGAVHRRATGFDATDFTAPPLAGRRRISESDESGYGPLVVNYRIVASPVVSPPLPG